MAPVKSMYPSTQGPQSVTGQTGPGKGECVCVCACVCVCMCTCALVCLVCMCVCVCVCVHACMHAHRCSHVLGLCVCVCVCVRWKLCTHVYMVCLLQSWYTDRVIMIVCCSCNMCPSVELLASYYKTYSEIIIKTKRLTITINMFTLFFTFVCVLLQ